MATSSAAQGRILVVAALGRELAGLTKAAHPDLALLETGEGTANAKRELEAWLERESACAVLSLGFAGALSDSLDPGDLVIAREVLGANEKPDSNLLAAATRLQTDGTPLQFGVAVTVDEIVWRAASKRALAASLGKGDLGFVDMESTAIARVCGERNLPFLIVRSITDLLNEDLPLDFNKYRDEDGRVNSRRVAKAALLKPKALGGLLELRKRSELCAGKMAELVLRLIPMIS